MANSHAAAAQHLLSSLDRCRCGACPPPPPLRPPPLVPSGAEGAAGPGLAAWPLLQCGGGSRVQRRERGQQRRGRGQGKLTKETVLQRLLGRWAASGAVHEHALQQLCAARVHPRLLQPLGQVVVLQRLRVSGAREGRGEERGSGRCRGNFYALPCRAARPVDIPHPPSRGCC